MSRTNGLSDVRPSSSPSSLREVEVEEGVPKLPQPTLLRASVGSERISLSSSFERREVGRLKDGMKVGMEGSRIGGESGGDLSCLIRDGGLFLREGVNGVEELSRMEMIVIERSLIGDFMPFG